MEDLLVNQEGETVGFRLEQKGLFLRDCFLPISHLLQIKSECLVINQSNHQAFLPIHTCIEVNGLLNKRLLSDDERLIGIVKDVYLSPDLGRIELIEISEGWFADLQEGRKRLAWNEVNCEKDALRTKFIGGGASDEMPKLCEQKPWENRL